jgi:hypothetical protein
VLSLDADAETTSSSAVVAPTSSSSDQPLLPGLEKVAATTMEDDAGWATSPHRLSVLSRVLGLGTGEGAHRFTDRATGAVLSARSAQAKHVDRAVAVTEEKEAQRQQFLMHLHRTASREDGTATLSPPRSPLSLPAAGVTSDKPAQQEEKQQQQQPHHFVATPPRTPSKLSQSLPLSSLLPSSSSSSPFTSRAAALSHAPAALFGSSPAVTAPASLFHRDRSSGAESDRSSGPNRDRLALRASFGRKLHFRALEDSSSYSSATASMLAASSSLSPTNSLLRSSGSQTDRPRSLRGGRQQQPQGLFVGPEGLDRTTYVQLPASATARVHAFGPPEGGGGSGGGRSVRPFTSISRAGSVSFGAPRIDLESAHREARQGLSSAGGGGARLLYSHVSSLHSPSAVATGAGASSAVAAASSAPSSHSASLVSSGPSLLPASSVAAIERFLHTQLSVLDSGDNVAHPALEAALTASSVAASSTATRKGDARRHASAAAASASTGRLTAVDIRTLEELATREQHAARSRAEADAQARGNSSRIVIGSSSRSNRNSGTSVANGEAGTDAGVVSATLSPFSKLRGLSSRVSGDGAGRIRTGDGAFSPAALLDVSPHVKPSRAPVDPLDRPLARGLFSPLRRGMAERTSIPIVQHLRAALFDASA